MNLPDSIELVTDQQRLNELCQIWKIREVLALDTEFMRVSTFYPIAGLIQVGDLDRQYLIDPLAIQDWDEFKAVLTAESVTKILHSCSEDLVLFHSMFGCVPAPLVDTQRAAAFLGYGFSISYLNLVLQLTGVTLEKGETRSDWLKRPLTDKQIHYAALDVVYLPAIWAELRQRLQQKNYLAWFEADCRQLATVAGQADDKESWQIIYQNMCACERQKPRTWIARDADLIALDEKMPADRTALNQIKDMTRNLYQHDADTVLKLIASSKAVSAEEAAQVEGLPLTQPQRQLLKRCQQQ